jgi:hypothetical protein
LFISLIDVITSEAGLDPNIQSYNVRTREMTPLHLLVVSNDYAMMSKFLEFKGVWRMGPLEMGLKDGRGRNPCDLAIENGF